MPTRRDYVQGTWDYFASENALTREMTVSHAKLPTVLESQCSNGLTEAQAPQRVDDAFLYSVRHYGSLGAPKTASVADSAIPT